MALTRDSFGTTQGTSASRFRRRYQHSAIAAASGAGGVEGDDEPTDEDLREAAERSGLSASQIEDLSGEELRARILGETASPSESSGTIEDLIIDDTGNITQQVLPGSNASLAIAEAFNPGFVNTEVVNRMGLVLSLNMEFDPTRGEWVPSVVDETERAAVEQALAVDGATDDLTGVVNPGPGTEIDGNGDLRLQDGIAFEFVFDRTPDAVGALFSDSGLLFVPAIDIPTLQARLDEECFVGNGCKVVEDATGNVVATSATQTGTATFDGPFLAGTEYRVLAVSGGSDDQAVNWDVTDYPIGLESGDVIAGYSGGASDADNGFMFDKLGGKGDADEGTATSTFDNPCRTSGLRQSSYNVCSSSSDVTVDLYDGDPLDESNEPLRRDIDEREDISDLPPGIGNLQYHLTLRRGDDGESPKVERLGHQYIK